MRTPSVEAEKPMSNGFYFSRREFNSVAQNGFLISEAVSSTTSPSQALQEGLSPRTGRPAHALFPPPGHPGQGFSSTALCSPPD